MISRKRHFFSDQGGATIIEFAVVAPVFFLLLMIIIELGLINFSQVAVEAALAQASRSASIGDARIGGDRVSTVRALVEQKTSGLINSAQITISATVVGQGTTAPPDYCLDPPGTPVSCPSNNFVENNGTPSYQGPGAVSLGGSGDLIELRVSYPWRVQMPLLSSIVGQRGVMMISSTTVVKNEPF